MSLKSSYSNDSNVLECGIDEAGRGAIAGPLCVAAVIFSADYQNEDINDSKKLTELQRNYLRTVIQRDAIAWSVVFISNDEIDRINILQATFKGMNEAVKQLKTTPQLLLIDGNRFTNKTNIPFVCCVKGDAEYLSIAAASILAKTHRDDKMASLAKQFSYYQWDVNKGYPTPFHKQKVLEIGNSAYHRKSFKIKTQLKFDF